MSGFVALVGAGCSSPRWLASEAAHCLRAARHVVYDRLIHPDALQIAPDGCEFYAVGKREGDHTMEQDEINSLLVELGREDGITVRLKGGDPFVFGRGGEEALALEAAGIEWSAVPGATAALGGAMACGVPVTHRGTASSVTLATGHFRMDDEELVRSLAAVRGTVALYMAASRFAELAPRLVDMGRSPDEPALAVRWGGWGRASEVRSTLAGMAELARAGEIASPSVIYVGGTSGMKLSPRVGPLAGLQVAVCRPYPAGWDTARELERLGADAYSVPLLALEPLAGEDAERVRALLASADWIVLTSPRGAGELLRAARDLRLIRGRVAAIGEATARAAAAVGLPPDAVAERADSHGLADLLRARVKPGELVVFARNERGSNVAVQAVRDIGAVAESIATYRMAPREIPGIEVMREQWEECGLDAVAFGSSAMAEAWNASLGEPPRGAALVAWGRICADTLERTWGRRAVAMPSPDAAGLARALETLKAE